MPLLENAKWENFAQNVANGVSLKDAYTQAGFAPSKAGPTRLKQKPEVGNRIAELQQNRADTALSSIVDNIEYTREKLLRELEEARQIALLDLNGSAMSMATLGKAKILGLIIDRREVGDVGAFDGMTDDELVKAAAKKAKELGVPHLKLVDDEDESAA